jgi:3-oxoacyl-[acyl-carrier-protein] synthase II
MDGITRTIKLGLKDAAISADAVDFVSAHATGTKMGDAIEAQATGKVYGESPVVSGLKSYMGHTMGSCGAIETIISIYLMEEGFIAPTLNLEKIDKRCAMIRHAQNLVETDIRTAAIQNFAFGGVNTCLLIRKI